MAGTSKPAMAVQQPVQLAPPSLNVAAGNPDSALVASLVSTNAALPKAQSSSLKVSQGVTQGLLLKKVEPLYPSMALQLGKGGAVELLATISKSGDITHVKVLSGDPVLARAATDAVKQWKYRPYLLNGQPVDIQTEIKLVFNAPR